MTYFGIFSILHKKIFCCVCHEFYLYKKRLLRFKTQLILELILKWTSREIMYMCAWWRAIYSYFSSFFKCIHLALCNGDANGNVPLGKSCNRYWNCQGGYPRRKLSTFFFALFTFNSLQFKDAPLNSFLISIHCVASCHQLKSVMWYQHPHQRNQNKDQKK